jgi:hypothetical protein
MSEPLVPHADLLLARDQHSPQSIVYRAIDELLRHRAPACECADRPAWCSAISGCTHAPSPVPTAEAEALASALRIMKRAESWFQITAVGMPRSKADAIAAEMRRWIGAHAALLQASAKAAV